MPFTSRPPPPVPAIAISVYQIHPPFQFTANLVCLLLLLLLFFLFFSVYLCLFINRIPDDFSPLISKKFEPYRFNPSFPFSPPFHIIFKQQQQHTPRLSVERLKIRATKRVRGVAKLFPSLEGKWIPIVSRRQVKSLPHVSSPRIIQARYVVVVDIGGGREAVVKDSREEERENPLP